MRKFSLISCFAIVIAAASCQEESLICTTCAPPDECPTCPPPRDDDGGPSCIGPDFIITSVVSAGEPDELHQLPYEVFVKNVGLTSASITNLLGFQGYLSRDGVTRDIAACGRLFQTIDGPLLGINETTSASINCTLTGVDLSSYPFLIVDLIVSGSLGECNSTNNTFVITPLPL